VTEGTDYPIIYLKTPFDFMKNYKEPIIDNKFNTLRDSEKVAFTSDLDLDLYKASNP
jgi:hypothetical protein